jgi:hypothetical protein
VRARRALIALFLSMTLLDSNIFHPESTPSMDYPGPEGRMEGSVVVQKFVRAKGIA